MRLDLAFQMFLGLVISASIKIIAAKNWSKIRDETIQITLFSIALSILDILNQSFVSDK